MRTPTSPPMRSSNPALREDVLTAVRTDGGGTMTVQGTVNKTSLLLVLALATATAAWVLGTAGGPGVAGWAIGASLAGLGVAIATIVRPRWSPITAPIYALVEGVVLGVVSMWFEAAYPGIAIQAVALTFGVMGAMLVVAALNLLLDFDLIERGARAGAPAYMEWYAAFGLLVTLVWLYLELLRLLA